MQPEDESLGELFELLRRQRGLTQQGLATGRAGELVLERVRRLFAEVDGRARLSI